MIKTLRKRHLQIWILWAVLIPAGIITAWMAVPKKATQELLQPPAKANKFSLESTDTINIKNLRQ
jgi:hypothetical protein